MVYRSGSNSQRLDVKCGEESGGEFVESFQNIMSLSEDTCDDLFGV